MNMILSSPEKTALTECERVIDAGQKAFVEVGQALLKIRESRLYRAEHGTFEEYCKVRWNWSGTHAHRMIGAAKVATNVSPMGELPVSERVVRPLAKLQPEQQREVWQKANEKAASEDRPVTARDVGKMVVGIVPRNKRRSVDALSDARAPTDDGVSNNLYSLNFYWKRASKSDRRQFVEQNRATIGTHYEN